ncbi:MAG: histidinol dehydrogenase [Spirochaetales bacterium]|nr:histidinol dehydrogenase [Spirochaetales bacterium]MDD6841990.1 histidinol dehydrogenase [Spirochaetales bacterium]
MIKIMKYGVVTEDEIFSRSSSSKDVSSVVSSIIKDVQEKGDEALREYTKKLDGADISEIEVSKEEIKAAADSMDSEFMRVLEKAASNIRKYHSKQVRNSFVMTEENGIVLGQKIVPVSVAGIYVPGGTAAYPSTVLMDTIPAKIAGCGSVIMVSPPGKDGKLNPAVLASAYVAGVDRVFRVGGAQAIAALAYGTETIPRADKIVGPGNIYVAEAKKQVSGVVSIDMIAGPSEILIISDGASKAKVVAADMLSQAEHDKNASAVLITDSERLAEEVRAELEVQLPLLPRYDIARASIDTNGKIIVVDSIEKAIEVSDRIAPEHLEVCVDNPFDYLDKIHNAGSVFLGRNCPEALGDYIAGPNHTLPTSGTARFSSPLSVDDFVKKYQFSYYTQSALASVADDVALFARREGLEAHARSALVRKEEEK